MSAHLILSRRRAAALALLLGALGLACSSSSEPSQDLTFGTFLVTMPQFAIPSPGPCDVAPFQLTVEKSGTGQTQVITPQATFTCTGSPGTFDLDLTDFAAVGDSLQMELTYTGITPNFVLTMRWHPGSTDIAGSAVFDLSSIGVDTVTWAGVRQ